MFEVKFLLDLYLHYGNSVFKDQGYEIYARQQERIMDSHIATEPPLNNPSGDKIKEVLEKAETIAVVGLSINPDRDSYRVAAYLKEMGYKIIPVNPTQTEILGEKSYPDLESIQEKIDIVDIFRKPDAIPGIVDQAIKMKAGCVWMQLGLSNNESAAKAKKAGLTVVQSMCIKVEHSRFF